jgi:transposase-like protein
MKTYGLSKTSVIQLLEANGVELRRQPPSPESEAEAVRLYREERRSLSTIVARLGLPRETVRRSLIQTGVEMRGRGGRH